MHKTGWYIDLRIVFTHSFEHEIPNLVFNLVSLEKRFRAIVNWVLKHPGSQARYQLETRAVSGPQSRSIYGLNSHLPPWNNTLKSDLVLEFSIKARAQERY